MLKEKQDSLIKPYKILLIGLFGALLTLYPEITWIPYILSTIAEESKSAYVLFFIFRYAYYVALIFFLTKYNLQKLSPITFGKRFVCNAFIGLLAFVIYATIYYAIFHNTKHLGSLMLFQFIIMCVLCTCLGYIYQLYQQQRIKEQEIELLKVENLQSRYDALTNQINPHFFFNSLNGLTSLIRKKDDKVTLAYVDNLSDVFRYILQSDRKGLVSLSEELEFVEAFRYLMEVRFANKLAYNIDVDGEDLFLKLPVLSIMPLLDNVVVHNRIDSEHKMEISIYVNNRKELVVSNPIYPKMTPSMTNGTGLKNLENRFSLLMNKQIRIEQKENLYTVYLPLK